MSQSKNIAIEQIDAVITQYEDERAKGVLNAEQTHRVITRMRGVLARLCLPGSVYDRQAKAATNEFQLLGIVKALRDDYEVDYLKTFRQLLHADLFSNFLEMANYLLADEKLKQPAAVLASGVLEEHLRKLCDALAIATVSGSSPRKAAAMNDDLSKAGLYGKNEHKQITAWLGIRNSAAHARYDEFDEQQVRSLIDGLRAFISKYPGACKLFCVSLAGNVICLLVLADGLRRGWRSG